MPELQLGSVVIYVPQNAKKILDFYIQAFGVKLRHYDANFDFGELETGTTSIAICTHAAGQFMVGEKYEEFGDGYPKNTELAFLTKDVASAFVRAVEAGCVSVSPPKSMPWGQTVAYVRSIEGTLVGFLTPMTMQS